MADAYTTNISKATSQSSQERYKDVLDDYKVVSAKIEKDKAQ